MVLYDTQVQQPWLAAKFFYQLLFVSVFYLYKSQIRMKIKQENLSWSYPHRKPSKNNNSNITIQY